LGDFDRFVTTLAGIRTPTIGGRDIDLIAKSRRGTIIHIGEKFRKLPMESKERFVDMLVDLFSFDVTSDQSTKLWNEILNLEEVGDLLKSLDSEFKKFNTDQRIAIEKESIDLATHELLEIERELEQYLSKGANLGEEVLVAIQTIYMCRIVLEVVKQHIEKKRAIDKTAIQVQVVVLAALARLDSFRRRKTSKQWIYDGLTALSILLSNEDVQALIESSSTESHAC